MLEGEGDRVAQHRRRARDGVVPQRALDDVAAERDGQVARALPELTEIRHQVQPALVIGQAPLVNQRAGIDAFLVERGEGQLQRRRQDLDLYRLRSWPSPRSTRNASMPA